MPGESSESSEGQIDATNSVGLDSAIDELQRVQAIAKSNRTLSRFAPIQRGTQCPFAKRARLWGAHIEDEGLPRRLADFVRQSDADEKLDGFVVELPNDTSFAAFADSVRRGLTLLSDADPAGEAVMRKKYIGEIGWHFRFAGAPFFVTTFSPFYPESSPRYAFGAEAAFVLLQPERSFLRHNLPADDGTAPGVRKFVRAAFAASGRAFVPPPPRSANAHQVVRPLKEGDPPVRWWVEPSTAPIFGADTVTRLYGLTNERTNTDASTEAGSDYASSAASEQAADRDTAAADQNIKVWADAFQDTFKLTGGRGPLHLDSMQTFRKIDEQRRRTRLAWFFRPLNCLREA